MAEGDDFSKKLGKSLIGANGKINVPANSLMTLVLEMAAANGEMHPTEPRATRTSYMLRMWRQAAERMSAGILKNLALGNFRDIPYFLVPVDQLSGMQYARFVYAFINDFYNPTKKIHYTDGMEAPTQADVHQPKAVDRASLHEVPCTLEEMRDRFGWLHANSVKLDAMARSLVPKWSGEPNDLLPEVMVASRQASRTWELSFIDATLQWIEHTFKTKITSAAQMDEWRAGEHGAEIECFEAELLMPFFNENTAVLKQLAKKIGITPIALNIVSIDYHAFASSMNVMERAAKHEEQKKEEASKKEEPKKEEAKQEEAKQAVVPSEIIAATADTVTV